MKDKKKAACAATQTAEEKVGGLIHMFDYSRNKEEKQDPRAERETTPEQGTGKYRVMVWDGDKLVLNNLCDMIAVCGFTPLPGGTGEVTQLFQVGLEGATSSNAAAFTQLAVQLQVVSRRAVRQVLKLFPNLTEQTLMDLMRDGVETLEKSFAEQEADHADEE